MTYGTPPSCIPIERAAAAASMTVAELKAALGGRVIIVGPIQLGVRPADLDAVSPGASNGVRVVYSPAQDAWF